MTSNNTDVRRALICTGGLRRTRTLSEPGGRWRRDTHPDRLGGPSDITPNINDGKAQSSAVLGTITVVVGDFTSVTEPASGQTFARANIFAFNNQTGDVLTTFAPEVKGAEINEVISAGDGNTVYISGVFGAVNGAPNTSRVARIDVTTGAVDTRFSSLGFNGRVRSLALIGGA